MTLVLRPRFFLVLAATIVWMSGCALNPLNAVTAGMSREEVMTRMGPPRAVVSLDKGTRLQYSNQSSGRYAYMVDIDESGRVLGIRQVLNARDFARIELGKWTRQDVLREFGPPSTIDHVASWKGDIMTYKWFDVQNLYYWVYLDGGDVVQRAHPGMEDDPYLPP